ncbi:MAG TPA: CocE/NonD family hydrolase [Povalibacter sp.]
MLNPSWVRMTAATLFALLFAPLLNAQQDGPLFLVPIPPDITARNVNIWSEGTRMSGTVFTSNAVQGEKLPAILMAHGWGGTASALRRDAIGFAKAGYLVVTFDYRGWGESDSRIIPAKPTVQRAAGNNRIFSTEVVEVREVVDPIDMLTDWQNALHWLHGEPRVDTSRIGVWGSSQSGGFVAELATRDRRIKVVYSQVGAFDGRELGRTPEANSDATRRARGEIGYPEPGVRVLGNLRGAPIYARFANYAPVEHINDAGNIPIRIVVAEKEELFDNDQHGILAYQRYQGPKDLVIVPGISHYGVYMQAWPQAHRLALEWFDRYLKQP